MKQRCRSKSDGVHLSEPRDHCQCRTDLPDRELHCASHHAPEISAKVPGKTRCFVFRAGQKYNGLAGDLVLSQIFHGLLSTFCRVENADSYFHSALPLNSPTHGLASYANQPKD